MQNIEQDLNKLKTWELSTSPTAEVVYNGLVGLGEVHKRMGNLQSLFQCPNK